MRNFYDYLANRKSVQLFFSVSRQQTNNNLHIIRSSCHHVKCQNDIIRSSCHNVVMSNAKMIMAQPAITCSKLTIETLEQGVEYVQS